MDAGTDNAIERARALGALPAAATLGVTQFNYGWSAYDFGRPYNDVHRSTYRAVARLAGSFAERSRAPFANSQYCTYGSMPRGWW